MHKALKIVLIVLALLASIAAGLLVYVQLRWDRTFEAPLPAIEASQDPEVIERGRYLVTAAAACVACHHPEGEHETIAHGGTLPVSGGREFRSALGVLRAPNISSHETGIGKRTDAEIARAIRHGVRADGRAMFPYMEFQTISDEDLVAIVSFLRASEPVDHEVADHEFSLLGKALMALAIEPVGPRGEISTRPPIGPTAEYGEYLARHVSMCWTCHTDHEHGGTVTGEDFAGGWGSPMENGDADHVIITPNLTPDPKTGVLYGWSEDEFLTRMRDTTPSEAHSIMPWGTYSRMTDDDLRALYRFFASLEPVSQSRAPGLAEKD